MAELQADSILQEWAKKFAPGLYKPPVLETKTSFPIDPSLSLPTSPTPSPSVPVVSPAPPTDAVEPTPATATDAAPGTSWTNNLSKGLQDPVKMGLLGAGLSMMATPPRAVPYSNMEVFGQAGLHGLKFFQEAVEAKRKDELMKQTAEEHALAREDRRQANLDRAQYYRDSAETRRMTAESLAQSRAVNEAYRKQLETNAALLAAPVPDAVWDANGHPEMKGKGITGNQYKEYGMAAWTKGPGMAMVTDDKGNVTITPKVPGVLPGAGKSKTQPAGTNGEGPGKTAAIALVNKEVMSYYLPIARDEISKNAAPGSDQMRQMVESLNTKDPTTGGPNEAKLREHLSAEQRKEFDFVKRRAQGYSKTMVPAEAVQKARDEWNKEHPAPKVDSRYEEYRRVYEEIRNYPGWSNAEKNAKINEMNAKARAMGLIK